MKFFVAENMKRREAAKCEFMVPDSIPPTFPLPSTNQVTNRHAVKLATEIAKAKPAEDGRVTIRTAETPEVICTPSQAERITGALHVLIEFLAQHDITPAPGTEKNPTLRLIRNPDTVFLRIEEELETVERKPTAEEKRRPSWEWNTKSFRSSGRLTFRFSSTQQLSGRRQWSESNSRALEELLPVVAGKLIGLFQSFTEGRTRVEQRRKEQEEQSRKWEEERKLQKHHQHLQQVAAERAELLQRAAQWWQLYKTNVDFIAECEKHWRDSQAGQLTTVQQNWLVWALKNAEAMSPLAAGYPDPGQDGPFDVKAVPLSGPYPSSREMPEPPTFRKEEQARPADYHYYQQTKPYPFWLRNQRR